ncbi:MAG: lipopolysaccharide assembly protein LapB [Proteobacteria bacterium]|jgi:lipopolysaccharide biosynthesis regulator YciM|nr:lipopolysaccharide assembly protein LapB [Pseudomonadota bacterium]
MTDWPLLLILLLLAIAVGWYLGRRERKRSHYYEMGLRHLLNDEPDQAVATLVTELDFEKDSIDTHLALGGLLRRRGELEKAVFVHENVLGRARLDQATRHMVEIELARDYLQAGLLDRAEAMSMRLAAENPEYRSESLKVALQVYEQERDWHKAKEIAQQVSGGIEEAGIEQAISHYCCELAELAIAEKNSVDAKAHLTEAIGHDANNSRVSLLQGQLAINENDPESAVRHLERILVQDPIYVSESLLPLRTAYEALENMAGFRGYLEKCLDRSPSIAVVLALGKVISDQEGADALARFIGNQMQANPSLRGFIELIDVNLIDAEGRIAQDLMLLKQFAEAMISDSAAYRCGECGFEGKRMRWHCPSCRHWASIKPMLGQEGD